MSPWLHTGLRGLMVVFGLAAAAAVFVHYAGASGLRIIFGSIACAAREALDVISGERDEARRKAQREKADDWNRRHQTGVSVVVMSSPPWATATRTSAFFDGEYAWVCVSEVRDPVRLDHVTAIAPAEPPSYERAGGAVVCVVCGKRYREHSPAYEYPGYNGFADLTRLCDGRIVKL